MKDIGVALGSGDQSAGDKDVGVAVALAVGSNVPSTAGVAVSIGVGLAISFHIGSCGHRIRYRHWYIY